MPANAIANIVWAPDPVIFELLGFQVRYYGLLFMTGIVLSVFLLRWMYRQEGLQSENLDRLVIYGVIGILVGARLGHCLLYEPGYYLSKPVELLLPIHMKADGGYAFIGYQGLASHGGAAGLVIALYFYCRKTKEPMLKLLDMLAVAAPLGSCFIRIANLMNSEIIGLPTNKPWGFVFKRIDNVPRHPAQLYEALSYIAIFAVMIGLYKGRRMRAGSGFFLGLSILLIFSARFLIEFLKERQADFESNLPLDMGQILSIPFIAIGLFLVIRSVRKSFQNHPPD